MTNMTKIRVVRGFRFPHLKRWVAAIDEAGVEKYAVSGYTKCGTAKKLAETYDVEWPLVKSAL